MSEEIPIYQHESLPDPRTYIRLLQIRSIDEARDIPVHCQIKGWAIDAAPAYTTMSYTWGDPNLLEVILVDGKKMEVRQNCSYVLRQAWRLKGSNHIWIDAICINQTDNNEKSPQVAMMGSIYQKAVQTLACVGQHESDSEFLYEILHEKSLWWNKEAKGPLILDFPRAQQIFRLRRADMWGFLLRNSIKARLLKAFNSFLGRRYFRRAWIYQEVFFGRDIRVCCEDESVQILKVFQLYQALDQWLLRRRIMLRCPPAELQQWAFHKVRTRHVLTASVSTGEKAPLTFLIPLVAELQCEDPRDRIYGTLAVIDWGGMQPIEPDYNRDRFELALEVLQRIDGSRNFLTWVSDVQNVAKSLDIGEQPPKNLSNAIRERLLLHSSNSIITNPHRPDEGYRQEMTRFWGIRLLLNNATWKFDRNTETPATGRLHLQRKNAPDTSQGIFPEIQEWSNENPLDSAQADIVLSPGAKSQDWLLVPYSVHYHSSSFGGYMPAFLARKGDQNLYHLVGKVLIFAQRLWPNFSIWVRFWEKDTSSTEHRVHIDPEDGLLLAHSLNWQCNWQAPMIDAEGRRQLAEKYFETKLCGSKSCSYAVPRA